MFNSFVRFAMTETMSDGCPSSKMSVKRKAWIRRICDRAHGTFIFCHKSNGTLAIFFKSS